MMKWVALHIQKMKAQVEGLVREYLQFTMEIRDDTQNNLT